VLAAGAVVAVVFWPTRARKLSRALDVLLEAIEREDVDAASSFLAPDFRFSGAARYRSGDRAAAIEALREIARETEQLQFREIDREVDAERLEIRLDARVRADTGFGTYVERFRVELLFATTDGSPLILAQARFQLGDSR
jgi:glycine/D-amino acid oxidase-like deaminating enzyme